MHAADILAAVHGVPVTPVGRDHQAFHVGLGMRGPRGGAGEYSRLSVDVQGRGERPRDSHPDQLQVAYADDPVLGRDPCAQGHGLHAYHPDGEPEDVLFRVHPGFSGLGGKSTGAFAGASGPGAARIYFTAFEPRYTSGKHKGQCNGNANPLAKQSKINNLDFFGRVVGFRVGMGVS